MEEEAEMETKRPFPQIRAQTDDNESHENDDDQVLDLFAPPVSIKEVH